MTCSKNLVFQNPVDMEFVVTVGDFTRAAKSRIRATPKSQPITKMIDTTQKMIDVKMNLADSMPKTKNCLPRYQSTAKMLSTMTTRLSISQMTSLMAHQSCRKSNYYIIPFRQTCSNEGEGKGPISLSKYIPRKALLRWFQQALLFPSQVLTPSSHLFGSPILVSDILSRK